MTFTTRRSQTRSDLSDSLPAPAQIFSALETRVFGQRLAVREISVAIAKKLAGLPAGNVLLIGPSGSGKTTVMRAVESYLASDPALASRSTLIRVHANILAQRVAHAGRRLLLGRRFVDPHRDRRAREARRGDGEAVTRLAVAAPNRPRTVEIPR